MQWLLATFTQSHCPCYLYVSPGAATLGQRVPVSLHQQLGSHRLSVTRDVAPKSRVTDVLSGTAPGGTVVGWLLWKQMQRWI